ncbi:unnamed protein product [Victoria cruziana]
MDLASSPDSLPKISDEVDSSWINSCFLDNGEVSTLGAHDWGALKNVLDEIVHDDVSQDQDQRSSDEREIYEALLKAKGIKGLDDLQNDYVYPVLDPDDGIKSTIAISSAGGMEYEESIFKVWDLDTETEEGEFERELKKALADSKPASPDVPFGIEATKEDAPMFVVNDQDEEPFSMKKTRKDDPILVLNDQDKEIDLNLLISDMADLSLSNQIAGD